MKERLSWLKAQGRYIVDETGKKIFLRGVNLGGWLMMEGYILHGRNFPAQQFKRQFARVNGKKQLENFKYQYRKNFITEQDIQRIKGLGANCLRVPFNYRLIQKDQAWHYLDNLISWCRKAGIWCILDLHAAPGAQNCDWHSDSDGRALFWREQKNQKLFLNLWRRIARRYQNESTIAGYDVINEPVPEQARVLPKLYAQVIQEIRKVDNRHIIFLEAHNYGQELKVLGPPAKNEKNIVYSIHVYQPINFTFNFQPQLRYPGIIDGRVWDKRQFFNYLKAYQALAEKWQLPIYVGEFGINYRSPKYYGELRFLNELLQAFKKFGFHWTYWTYKAVAGGAYPDGLYQYLPNSPWIKREGPLIGWENYYQLWKTHQAQIISSWRSDKFSENKHLTKLLSKYF
ncbi:MAG: cellulase family glycosylhydrolase [Candidatus Omnitrophica bacterium]|nr:cellulase family glycosylhydrolase [Candidatus Omnitrophota bacterium]